MWKDAYAKGLRYIYQLFENNNLKSEQTIVQQYGITQLRYNSLKSAIPRERKTFFQETPMSCYLPIPPPNYDTCLYVTNILQKVYKSLAEDVMLIHNKYIKWRMELGEDYQQVL